MARKLSLGLLMAAAAVASGPLPPEIEFLPGSVNGLLVEGKVLVYGDAGGRPRTVPWVLFAEARRDVVWAGERLISRGAAAVAPERERALFETPGAFWAEYEIRRFHDYSEINTKVLRNPMRVTRVARGGETWIWTASAWRSWIRRAIRQAPCRTGSKPG